MISFSGIDCSGKSSQLQKVYEFYKTEGVKCRIIHSRGGYTPLLEKIKSLIRRDKNTSQESQDKYRKQIHNNNQKRKLLFWLSILDLGLYYGIYFRFVELFGTIILADRYFWDSYIDFKLKFKEYDFEKWNVWKFTKIIYLKPKYSIIYTISAELSMYRSTLKDDPWPEKLEERKARIGMYINEINKGKWMQVIDATRSIEEVFQETVNSIVL